MVPSASSGSGEDIDSILTNLADKVSSLAIIVTCIVSWPMPQQSTAHSDSLE